MDQETSFSQIFDSSDAGKSQPRDLSGSQLPDFTPSSTAEPISRPAVQDTAVGRVLPFTQVAPGLHTPIHMGNTTSPSSTGAAATRLSAASGAATGAPAAGAQVLESVAQAQARKRLERIILEVVQFGLQGPCARVQDRPPIQQPNSVGDFSSPSG